jgi:predicted RNA-binding protein with RPS1 domain
LEKTVGVDQEWTIQRIKEFEDTKGVISIRKSKMNRQHNGQKKKDKRTNNNLQNIHIKLATLGTQDTGRRQTKQQTQHRKLKSVW